MSQFSSCYHWKSGVLLVSMAIAVGASTSQDSCNGPATFENASRCCKERGSNSVLARVTDHKSYLDMADMMREMNVTSSWLNIRREQLDTFEWIDGTPLNGGFMVPGYTRDDQRCGILNSVREKVEVAECALKNMGTICEYHGCSGCAALGSLSHSCVRFKTTCFVLFCGVSDWYSGRALCLSQGWDLAVLTSPENIQGLTGSDWFTAGQVCPQYWIGLRKNLWKSGGKEVMMRRTYWGEDEPADTGRCAVVVSLGTRRYVWRTSSCNEDHAYICQFVDEKASLDKDQEHPTTLHTDKPTARLVKILTTSEYEKEATGRPVYIERSQTIVPEATLAVVCTLLLVVIGLLAFVFYKQMKGNYKDKAGNTGTGNGEPLISQAETEAGPLQPQLA